MKFKTNNCYIIFMVLFLGTVLFIPTYDGTIEHTLITAVLSLLSGIVGGLV